MCSGKSRQAGFTYIGLLITVAMISTVATGSLGAGAALQQRHAEAELLVIGQEFRRALQSYADATPVGMPTEPRALEELLRDPRYPGVRRHMRRIQPDPLTGRPDWGILRAPDGRIAGIHSMSASAVIRETGFPAGLEGFEKARRHDEWIFTVTPPSRTGRVSG